MNTDEFSFDQNNTKLLISLIPITRGSLLQRRQEIRKSFVKAALSKYPVGSTIDIKKLSEKIKVITKCELSEESIVLVLNQLSEEGIVQHLKNYIYHLNKKISLINFEERTHTIWNEFFDYLKKNYKEYDPFLDKEAKNIFDVVMLKLLERFVLSSDPLERKFDSLPLENFEDLAQNLIIKDSISKDLADKFPKILYSYLVSNPPQLSKFIFDNYFAIINMHLTRLEKQMKIGNLLSEIKYLLVDTQFLVFLLCNTDPLYPLTNSITNLCKKLEIPIYYTEKTKRELWRFINGTKREIKGFSKSKKHKLIISQFITDYLKKNIRWDDYITIVESWQISVKKWNIFPFPKENDRSKMNDIQIDEDVYSYITKTIPIFDNNRYQSRLKKDTTYVHNFREPLQIEHDAYCLGLISYDRQKNEIDGIKPFGPWFVSYDTLVGLVDAAYSKNTSFGLVIHPRSLFNYLLVYSNFDFKKEDEGYIAEAIIKYTASTHDMKLTMEDYSKLVTNKLGLEEENFEIVKRVLITSPLRSELERALRLNRGDLADEIAYRIFTDESIISTIITEKKSLEKLRTVTKKLKEKEEELDKEKAKVEELEKVIKSEKQLTVITNVNIDITTQNEMNNLIHILENNNAFESGVIERPPKESTIEKFLSWLEKLKNIIETSEKIGEGIKALLPFILYLIKKLGGT